MLYRYHRNKEQNGNALLTSQSEGEQRPSNRDIVQQDITVVTMDTTSMTGHHHHIPRNNVRQRGTDQRLHQPSSQGSMVGRPAEATQRQPATQATQIANIAGHT